MSVIPPPLNRKKLYASEPKHITIETTNVDHDARTLLYILPNGDRILIGKHDRDFFEKLVQLPFMAKIILMDLSSEDMETYMKWENRDLRLQVISILDKEWYWRETGDLVEPITEIPGLKDSLKDISIHRIKTAITKGRKFSTRDLKTIKEFFLGVRSEVYLKDDNQ